MLTKWLALFFSLSSIASDHVILYMRNREMLGKTNPKQLRSSLTAIQYYVTIPFLQKIEYPFDFIPSVPEKYIQQAPAPFENNRYMDIIIAGLKNRSQYFKNAVLAHHLSSNYSHLNHCIHIALIDAGAHHEDSLRVVYANRGKKDYDYAKALLLRGANPNAMCKFFLPGQCNVLDEHLELSQLTDLDLIEILVDAGANVMATSRVFNLTLVHLAANYEKYEPEILEFYLRKKVDVDAKDFLGFTALERIIIDDSRYESNAMHTMMQEKVQLLLSYGASYSKAMSLLEGASRESWKHPKCIQKLQLLKEILITHDEKMQHQTVDVMECN